MNDKEENKNQEDNLNIEGTLEDVLKVSIPQPKEKDAK